MTHIVITTTETGVQHIGPFAAPGDATTWLQNRGITGLVVPLIGLTGELAVVPVLQFGKYAGRTVESVIKENPQYIVWAYKNVEARGGITDEQYRKAGGAPLPKLPEPKHYPPMPRIQPPAARDFSDDFADDDIPF